MPTVMRDHTSTRPAAIALLCLLVGMGFCAYHGGRHFYFRFDAMDRTTTILENLRVGGAGATIRMQTSALVWLDGSIAPWDQQLVDFAERRFMAWLVHGRIARRIGRYEVLSAKSVGPRTFVVRGTIEGRPFAVRVPWRAPIRWEVLPFGIAGAPASTP